MVKAILGKKLGMTQIFAEDGKIIPVTVIEAGPCVVVQKKSAETDGYNAIQVGFGKAKEKTMIKPKKGIFKKAGTEVKKYLKEFKVEDVNAYEIGQELKADVFATGDIVDVIGISKGKGFKGVIARWGNHRGPMAHGSRYHRRPGSMSAHSDPSRVFKNKKLPGHTGVERVTIQNLKVVKVDADKNVLLVRGAIPGAKGGLVTVKKSVKSSS